uniref:Amino acid transporter transmembrane domain-containing protein n=1 Tax=Plectus sambesii TaxID=2011161 RepID=A0A914W1G6_9BILA
MKRPEDDDTEYLLSDAEDNATANFISLKSPLGSSSSAMAVWKESRWPYIVNLSNSIIGVSILAMPFCLQQCGVLLGLLLLMGCSLLTRFTCHLLMKGAYLARRRSYEALALHAFGPTGKRFVELAMILFIMSTLCAFFVVIGDLGPHVVADYLELDAPTERMRILVILAVAMFFILPLSLLRNVDSLSAISSMAILFYGIFVIRLLAECLPQFMTMQWIYEVNWWRTEGVLQSLPIFGMALSCQTQLFIVAECMTDPSPTKMNDIIKSAVNLCTLLYGSVGFLGYVAFHDKKMHGDVLVYLDATFLTELLKLGFMLSVAVSFPLMLFPCRTAIFNILFRPTHISGDLQVDVIPNGPFQFLTVAILVLNLVVAVLLPNVEFVLGLTGSLIGSTVCTILPALMFIHAAPKHYKWTNIAAKAALIVGFFILIACTLETLQSKPVEAIPDLSIPKVIDADKHIINPPVLPDAPTTSTLTTNKPTIRSEKKEASNQVEHVERLEPVEPVAPKKESSNQVEHVERLEPVEPVAPVAPKKVKSADDVAQVPNRKSLAEIKQQEIFEQANSIDEKQIKPAVNEEPVRDDQVVPPAERLKRQSNETVIAAATVNKSEKPKQEN